MTVGLSLFRFPSDASPAAIAGTGFIGRVHARSVRLAGAELAGVAASTPECARVAAAELGADRAFDSAEEMVRDPDIDVVHICTPNHLHLPLAEAALAAGKHVICEKPLALDAAGAQRLVDAATDSGLHAAVPFVYRYYPTVREARERVGSGQTGALRLVHGTYLQDWLLRPDDDNWRVDEQLGGASRAFADIGSHWCDLAEFVSGHRIARVCPRGCSPRCPSDQRAGPSGVRVGRSRRRGASGHDRRRCPRPVRDGRRGDRLGRREPDLGGSQEPALDRARRRRGDACFRPGAARGALVRAPRGGDDPSPRSRDALPGGGPLCIPSRRPSPGLRGLLRRLRGRLLRRRSQRLGGGRDADVLRRAARRADHRCRPDLVP